MLEQPAPNDDDTPLVVYHDDHLLVLNKPAGLLCVPGRGPGKTDCLAQRALSITSDALIVHRLDMATSGLVIMAKSKEVQRTLGIAFANRQITKHYDAIVYGQSPTWLGPNESPHCWFDYNAPLIADWPNRPLQKIDAQNGKPAHTRIQWIAPHHVAGQSRVLLAPVTGRSHQLRVHMLSLGHPIVGDALYAPADKHLTNALPTPPDTTEYRQSTRLLLHACSLAFQHPVTGEPLVLKASAPFLLP